MNLSRNSPNQGPSSLAPDRTSLIAEANRNEMKVLSRRPERISLTVEDRPSQISFRHNLDTNRLEIKSFEISSSWANPSALLPDSQHVTTLFQPGDVIESINEFSCRGKHLGDLRHYLDRVSSGPITFVVSTTSNSGLHQAVAIKCPHKLNEEKEEEEDVNVGLVLGNQKEGLGIRRLSSQGWLGRNTSSLLEEGDLLVAINTSPCLALTDEEGQIFLDQNAQAQSFISVTVIPSTASQRHWRKARKVAAAVGGGTMVGVGAVMMVTPLHPVGHAMAIGGTCLIGKEFGSRKMPANKKMDSKRTIQSACEIELMVMSVDQPSNQAATNRT